MSSLSPKDRVSLCSFAFSDGRRCRTPLSSSHPHFCFYHAQKEARACAAQKLGKDLDYFFSGDYLSACDLSTALARLIPAVVRGEVKPKTAHTVAYLMQTLMQAIHVSQHEYCEAFDTDDWRQAIRNSVKLNHSYRFPPDPKPEPPAPSALRTNLPIESPQPQPASPPPQPQPPASQPVEPPVNCHSGVVAQAFRPEESASSLNSSLATRHSFTPSEAEGPLPQASEPTPSPHTSLPATGAEFAQHVLAGLPRFLRSDPVGQTGERQAPQPAQATASAAPAPSSTSAPAPPPIPATQSTRSVVSAPQSDKPLRTSPSTAPPAPAPQPGPVAQPFRSLALPPHVRRRLHRDPA